MIVKDEATTEEALRMLESSPKGVRFSDRWRYTIVTKSDVLEFLCSEVLEHDDIAIVAPIGQENKMENYAAVLPKVRKERAEERKKRTQKQMRKWVKEHPKEVERIMKRVKSSSI